MAELQTKSILDMAMGAIKERADVEMEKITQNILDPNTKAGKKRTLTITVDFTPDDDRQTIAVRAIAKCKLEPTTAIATTLFSTADENGELCIVEMTRQVPGQVDMMGGEEEQPAKLRMIK